MHLFFCPEYNKYILQVHPAYDIIKISKLDVERKP